MVMMMKSVVMVVAWALPLLLLLLSLSSHCDAAVVDFGSAAYLPASNGTQLFSWFFACTGCAGGGGAVPLTLWLQGGPGCSSMMGLLYENGPFHINASGVPVVSPYSWARVSHLLYIDSPVWTGLSYGAPTTTVSEDDAAAADVVLALQAFYGRHPALRAAPVFVTGESYSGKFCALVARRLLGLGVKVSGVAVGNALVDPFRQVTGFSAYASALGLVDGQQAAGLEERQRRVQQLILAQQWGAASDQWDAIAVAALDAGGWFNPADVRQFGFPDYSAGEAWLNLPQVRSRLGVPPIVGPFEMCNDTVGAAFRDQQMRSVAPVYAGLLDKGVRVLLFSGNMDFTIPTISTEGWVRHLAWDGSSAFSSANRTVWRYNNDDPFAVAGFVRAGGGLTLVSVPNAGHSVAQDQQRFSLDMFRIFIHNQTFPTGKPFPPSRRRRIWRR